ncbi:hypothetical protein A2716_00460 [candidate division WWE3 bacterium RIFCSPHIGHO2_01_FULL_40_23]|uniref:PDZ domain-containing protein n=1 Tax=candidate division WWE3 bacterium RIFCSPLOWO2_01_FULL_41_18 TaxID=1802625 RepID=A0A1F4VE51_UNCKA|nr:MAG: hypothetical protein A2716_00460 [candidate division WWE3 bacterium RIFCSPHIGHO2_01_FULL_40_23]OGC55467.1 MAG: hypothetical protein A3A78_00730 [candidate division WWE3 bacterium RIFCSPLOWO2_01_FULL_41_18]
MFKRASNFIILLLLLVSTFYGGFYFGKRGFNIEIKKNPPKITVINREPKDQEVDFEIFWQVWDSLNKKHIDRPLDAKKLVYGAVSGMVSSVGDEYTSFFTPPLNVVAKSTLNGVYEGIGAELGFKDKQLVIIAPLEGSPAEEEGITPGDKILEIEGASTVGITLSDAVSKIRGTEGTVSTLLIQTGENEPKEYKIVRRKIVSKSVSWKDLGDGIGYIRLARFGDKTIDEWNKAVDELTSQMPNLKGVVLDVRGNPGGYLSASVYIASEFVKSGLVLYEETADGTNVEYRVNREGKLVGKPVVVLVNSGSASASEIVSGALRDRLSAKLVGEKTFGKGTVQGSEEYEDGSSLHVTIAKWLTPKKVWVHKVGLEPDFVVERKEEDVVKGLDLQLDKAKEIIKAQIKS